MRPLRKTLMNTVDRNQRNGTTLVEVAFVLPVFLLFIFAMFEFGHALMISNMVNSIAKQAAHHGSFEDASTADVRSFANSRLNEVVGAGNSTVLIKNGAAFENSGDAEVSNLPNIELLSAESRQIFVVEISVPYDSVAIMPPFWIDNLNLRGVSIMRRE